MLKNILAVVVCAVWLTFFRLWNWNIGNQFGMVHHLHLGRQCHHRHNFWLDGITEFLLWWNPCTKNLSDINWPNKVKYLNRVQASFSIYHRTRERCKLNAVTKITAYSKRVQTCRLLCWIPGCYHSACKTHVRDRIFKSTPIHASVIHQITWNCWIHWIPVPFRENSNELQNT